MTGRPSDAEADADVRSFVEKLRMDFAARRIDRRQAAATLCAHVCKLLSVDMASIWELRHCETHDPVLQLVGSYDCVSGIPQTGELSLSGPNALNHLARLEGGSFESDSQSAVVRKAAWRESYWLPRNVGALLDSVIGINGTTQGVLCCEQRGHGRVWTTTERRLALTFANEVALAIAGFRRQAASHVHQLKAGPNDRPSPGGR